MQTPFSCDLPSKGGAPTIPIEDQESCNRAATAFVDFKLFRKTQDFHFARHNKEVISRKIYQMGKKKVSLVRNEIAQHPSTTRRPFAETNGKITVKNSIMSSLTSPTGDASNLNFAQAA